MLILFIVILSQYCCKNSPVIRELMQTWVPLLCAPTSETVDSVDQSGWVYWLLRSAIGDRQTADSYQLQFPTGLGTAAVSGGAEEASSQLPHMVPMSHNLHHHSWDRPTPSPCRTHVVPMEIARCAKKCKWPSRSFMILTLDKRLPVNRVSHGQLLSPASTHNALHARPKTHQMCVAGNANH